MCGGAEALNQSAFKVIHVSIKDAGKLGFDADSGVIGKRIGEGGGDAHACFRSAGVVVTNWQQAEVQGVGRAGAYGVVHNLLRNKAIHNTANVVGAGGKGHAVRAIRCAKCADGIGKNNGSKDGGAGGRSDHTAEGAVYDGGCPGEAHIAEVGFIGDGEVYRSTALGEGYLLEFAHVAGAGVVLGEFDVDLVIAIGHFGALIVLSVPANVVQLVRIQGGGSDGTGGILL